MTNDELEITEKLAQDFVELHNAKIREWHKLSGDSDFNFFFQATESQVGQDNGMGEIVFEISGDDSRTGHPILFEVPVVDELEKREEQSN